MTRQRYSVKQIVDKLGRDTFVITLSWKTRQGDTWTKELGLFVSEAGARRYMAREYPKAKAF